MNKQLIANLRVGDEVETQCMILDMSKNTFSSPHRAGEYFWKLSLGDVSGSIKAVLWDSALVKEPLKKGDVIFVRGEVNDYHGPQVVIYELKKLDPEKVNRRNFQPVSKRDPADMLAELKKMIAEEINDPHLKLLLMEFFNDRSFVSLFCQAPAARTIHHNYIGGLLEHVLEVADLCRRLVKLYPDYLRLDLLLAGAVLHDIGKIEEYDLTSLNFDFSDRGKLIGHICIGKELLDQKINRIPNFPQRLKMELEHMLLAHHGVREWGSPEVPKTIHAFALFHADLVSARMNQFSLILKKQSAGSGMWSEWDRYLERSVFLKPPDEEQSES